MTNLAPNPSFEDGAEGWNEMSHDKFPATSFSRGKWGTGSPFTGIYAYAISNHAYGFLDSDLIAVTPGAQYDLHAWVRGELDGDTTVGGWVVRAMFYDANGADLGTYQNADSGGSAEISTTWQQKGGSITVPSNATQIRIRLLNYMSSGWVAFDDVSLIEVGGGSNLVANDGFETADNWTERTDSNWPGTSYSRGTWGTAAPHSGSRAYVISNHAYGILQSDLIPVIPETEYNLSAWVRGKIDPDDSDKYWLIRANFYDVNGVYLSYQDVEYGDGLTIDETWRHKGGDFTTPANAAQIRIRLFNYMNTGWVAYDDVLLTGGNETVTQRVTYSLAGQAIAVRNNTQLLADDFEDGNAAGWQVGNGVWSVVQNNGDYIYKQADASAAYYSNQPVAQSGKTAYSWTATFESGSRWAGIFLFGSRGDTFNHGDSYMVTQANGNIRIYKYLNNSESLQASAPAATANGETHRYYVTYDPDTGQIDVFRDGELTLSWTDPSPLTSGAYVGLRTGHSSVYFDDVRVVNDDGLYYMHSDHLGSASAMSDANGALVPDSVARYTPFGDWRTEPTAGLTDQGYTGHKHNNLGGGADDLGLIYMNARYYVPTLNRF
ncbi:MAG: hypothetical protein GY803_06060, partial [Chloroflexi bacterium]|nr:hypothetical protein [Chloroflexota bacterium]